MYAIQSVEVYRLEELSYRMTYGASFCGLTFDMSGCCRAQPGSSPLDGRVRALADWQPWPFWHWLTLAQTIVNDDLHLMPDSWFAQNLNLNLSAVQSTLPHCARLLAPALPVL